MKFKIIIASIGIAITLITTIVLSLGNQNESKQENIAMQNDFIAENNLQENLLENKQESVQESTSNNITDVNEENQIKSDNSATESNSSTTKSEALKVQDKSEIKEQVKNNSNTSQINVKKETKIEQKQEEPKVQETETKAEEKTPTTPTKSDLSYWCAEGGKHHVAGDGANEHGYYNTWDDAYTAFENYTKGWASVQYKISQCACGKFYFWAIQ